jgi:hypothetical protein
MTTMLQPPPALRPARPGSARQTTRPADISESRMIALDASAASTFEALCRLNLTDSAMRLLHALGATGRAALLPSVLPSRQGVAQRLGFVWRVDGAAAEGIPREAFDAFQTPGHIKVSVDIRVKPAATGRAYLSAWTRFDATDDTARVRLLDGWAAFGTVASTVVNRTLARVKAYAEDQLEGEPTV